MKLPDHYIINDRSFSKGGLMAFAYDMTREADPGSWESDLYTFILDFLEKESPLVQVTSGTTGDPTILELEKESMLHSAQKTLDFFGLKRGDSALLCLPVNYIAGKMMVVRALLGGMNLRTVEPTGNPLEEFEGKADFAAMVPLQLQASIKRLQSDKQIRTLLVGGGETARTLEREIRKTRGCAIYETFGMSETYTHFAVRRMNGKNPERLFSLLPGVRVQTDNRGCLVVNVPGVTDEPVVTNDMVILEEDGRFQWLGRIDNVIKTGGIKINPEVLEDRIREITGLEVLVSSLPDERLGNRLVLVLEMPDSKDLPVKLEDQLKNGLQKHEVPKAIITLPSFPRNSSMKVDRLETRRWIKDYPL